MLSSQLTVALLLPLKLLLHNRQSVSQAIPQTFSHLLLTATLGVAITLSAFTNKENEAPGDARETPQPPGPPVAEPELEAGGPQPRATAKLHLKVLVCRGQWRRACPGPRSPALLTPLCPDTSFSPPNTGSARARDLPKVTEGVLTQASRP